MLNLDDLEKKLRSGEAEARRDAAVELGRRGEDAALLLFRAMGDTDWRVRKTAVEGLVAIRGERVIAGLIQELFAHDNAGARNSAIEALVHIGSGVVPQLLSALDSPDADVRKFIVDILGDIKDPRSVPALIKRLDDQDENICVAAAESLGKVGDRTAVDALIVCLTRAHQGWLDYAAAEALGAIGDVRALGPLLAALGRSTLREPVLEALGRIGNVNTLTPLIEGLSDSLRVVREVSLVALTSIYRKSPSADREFMVRTVRAGLAGTAVDLLEEMLPAAEGELQKATIAVLGWAGKESSIAKLLSLLKEEELEEQMAQSLKNISTGNVSHLLSYLASENALVRRTVARVLGEIAAQEAESLLFGLLNDENGHVRGAAATALGRLRSRKAIPLVLELLHDEYENVQEAAIYALADIGDESVLDDLVRDFSSQEATIRRNIAFLLGKFATDKAADALVFALKDEEPAVRKAVVQSLGNLAADRSRRPLMLAITDDDPEVRMLAAEALGRTDAPEVRAALVSLLEDNDLWVRAAAARSLGRMGAEACDVLVNHLEAAADIFLLALVEVVGGLKLDRALAPLIRLSSHADPEVRKHVLTALAGYRWEAVQRAILSRLSDPHWSVRKAAVDFLREKQAPSAEPLLERMANEDPDTAVRQAAKEALGR